MRLPRLLKDVLVYGASGMASQLLSLLLLPLYTHALAPSEYGVLAMTAVIPLLFVSIATGGMKSSVFYRFNKCATETDRGVMLTTGQLPVCVVSLVLMAACLLGCTPLTQLLIGHVDDMAYRAVQLSLIAATLATMAEIPRVAIQCYGRATQMSALALTQLLVTTITTIYLVIEAELGVLGVVWGSVVGQGYGLLFSLWALRADWGRRFDVSLYKEMVVYGLPYLPHRLMSAGMMFLGDYIVRERLGLAEAGIYNVAARFAVPVTFLTGAFYQAWQPYKYKVFADDPDPKRFYRSALTLFAAVMCSLWVGLALFGPEVLRLLTDAKFHAGVHLVWAIVLMRVMQGSYAILATGVDVATSAKEVPLTSLAGLVVMVISAWLLIPVLGPIGAAVAGALAWGTVCLASHVVSQRAYPIAYSWGVIAMIVMAAIVGVVVSLQLQELALWPRLAASCVVGLLYLVLVFGSLWRAPDERARLQSLMQTLQRKLLRRRSA
jgi:enterobacterial common antigen flippase